MRSTEPRLVVSLSDPALDAVSMGWDSFRKYALDRDPALIKELPGKRMARFYLRRAPVSLFQRYVMEAASESDRARRAFAVACVKAENFLSMVDAEPHTMEPMERVVTPSGETTRWSETQLEHIAPLYLEEIGGVAYAMGFCPPGSEPSYLVPQSVLHACAKRIDLLVVESSSISGQAPHSSPPVPGSESPTASG